MIVVALRLLLLLLAAGTHALHVSQTHVFTTLTETPDIASCHTPSDASPPDASGVVQCQASSFVWIMAHVHGISPDTRITIQMAPVGRDADPVWAWHDHSFPAQTSCLVGSFSAPALYNRFRDRTLVAQIVADSTVVAAIPFIVNPPALRSRLVFSGNQSSVTCGDLSNDGSDDTGRVVTVTDDSVLVLCVDVGDTTRSAPFEFEFGMGTTALSTFRSNGNIPDRVLFMPVPTRQLLAANAPNGLLNARFRLDGRTRVDRNFTLGGGATDKATARFCPDARNCTV
ncbi:Uncharacterized protein PBTT_07687 [Plasmodiophora brassicae]